LSSIILLQARAIASRAKYAESTYQWKLSEHDDSAYDQMLEDKADFYKAYADYLCCLLDSHGFEHCGVLRMTDDEFAQAILDHPSLKDVG
jgi:hypothetical protein